MYSNGYRGRREGAVKPSFYFALGLVFVVFAAALFLFAPPLVFLAMLNVCLAAACFLYFGLRKAYQAGLCVEIATVLIWVMRVLFFIGLLSFIVVEVFVLTGGRTDADADRADYVVVLGCGVDGETPSLMLHSRIEAAADYLKRNPEAKAVLSGRQGPGEDISEAEAIRRGLRSRGIDEERLILEEQSGDTIENIRFSLAMVPGGAKVAILSNDFHLYRARLIAAHEGYDISAVSAPTPRADLSLCYTVREYFSLAKVFLTYLFA